MSQCPQCGTATTVGQPFCGACGATLAPAAEAPTPDEGQTQIRGQEPTAQFPAQQPPPQQPQQQQWSQPQQPPAPQGQQYGAPQQPQYGAPQGQQQYGAPQQPQYGAPQGQQYGAPQQPQYGAPQGQQPGQQWGQPQYGGPQGGGNGVNFDFSKLLVGNWAGMAMVAGAALGVAFVISLILAFTTADKLDVASAIGATFLLTGATFGADLIQDDGDATTSLGQYPLLATLLALGAAVYLFRRSTANYTSVKEALIDAVRAALILAVFSTVLAIVMKIWEPKLKGYESSGGESEDFDFLGAPVGLANGKFTLSIGGSIFLPLIILALVLALTCLVRRDWLGDKVLAKVHDFVAAPIIGFTTLILATIPAGLLYMVAIIAGEKDARGFAPAMGLLGNLPGIGLHMIGLGSLSKLGFHSSSSDDDIADQLEEAIDDAGGAPAWVGDFAGDHGAIFWVALLVGIPALAAAVWMVIKRSTGTANPLYNVGVYIGSMLIVVPLLVRLSNVHVTSEFDSENYTIAGGLSGGTTLLLFMVFSLVAAAVILVVTGKLDVNALKAKASNFQSQPGQQPGQQQWGTQPPPQQYGQPGQQQWSQPQPPQGQPPQGQPPQGQPPQQDQWGQQQPPYGQQPPQNPQGGWQPPQQ
ncbi:hypothetical protein [Nocardioides sp. Root140]|uniref:hypothetical protein n=1 Tax=Nocardioides sp. Root140 TaxID=1736460 RepID=UPI000B17DB1E|nr:hypothetical protein [Nocardioides sp. Root140]